MAQLYPEFELPRYVLNSSSTGGTIATNLAGSAATPLSLEQIIACSIDPETTRQNLQFNDLRLGLGAYAGDAQLRQTITELYDKAKVNVTADDVVIANATTGANLLVLQTFLQKGDHVISLYPTYGQLVQYPSAVLGAEVSYWHLNPDQKWELDLEELNALIRKGDRKGEGKTKMLILNNPHNPTGTVISTSLQQEIVKICKENDILIFSDEIFRPLFHSPASPASGEHPATSLLEHTSPGFDKIIVTGSLSKPWGLSGVRVGWAVTTNPELMKTMVSMRQWVLQSVSVVDEVIAREALSIRCRGPLVEKTLAAARTNLALLKEVVGESKGRLECCSPAGAGTAFVKVSGEHGEAVDDVTFCHRLKEEQGVLFAPGSLTFGGVSEGDFKGYVRVHITAPVEMFREGMEGLRKFLEVEYGMMNGK